MAELGAPIRPYNDTRYLTYLLDASADFLVSAGAIVRPDEVIARVPVDSAVVAIADELRLSVSATARVVARAEGESVQAGERLGAQRVRFATRISLAPIAGRIVGLPESGALGIRPSEGMVEIRAHFGGTVTEAVPGRICVASPVSCLPFAFAIGNIPAALSLSTSAELMAMTLRRGVTLPTFEPNIVPVFAHLASLADLATLRPRLPTTIIVGSVPEAVAWELLSAETDRLPKRGDHPAIVALTVTNDSARGAEAAMVLAKDDGLPVRLERGRQLLTTHLTAARQTTADEVTDGAFRGFALFRDPARWDTRCTVHGPPFITALDSGTRTLAVQTTSDASGTEHTPAWNLEMHQNTHG